MSEHKRWAALAGMIAAAALLVFIGSGPPPAESAGSGAPAAAAVRLGAQYTAAPASGGEPVQEADALLSAWETLEALLESPGADAPSLPAELMLLCSPVAGTQWFSCSRDVLRVCEAAFTSLLPRQAEEARDPRITVDVPVLMYHHFASEPTSDTVVTPETFALHLETLSQAGYQAVTVQELIDFVYRGSPLPDKPVCITMDDGYLSNYEIAWPLLQRYGMKATIFVIGCSIGHTEFYKDTQFAMTPHFSWEQAREMVLSGVMDIQSHTYDLHQWAPFESGDAVRTSMLPLEGESEEAWAGAVLSDLALYDQLRRQELGEGFCALAYPGGYFDERTEALLHQAGIPVTFTIRTDRRNLLVQGHPESLYALRRWNIPDRVTPQELLEMVSGQETG